MSLIMSKRKTIQNMSEFDVINVSLIKSNKIFDLLIEKKFSYRNN